MTTIAVCADVLMMAADSALNVGDSVFETSKLLRVKDWIIGAAGDCDQCFSFLEWAEPNPTRGRPKLRKHADFQGLVLTRAGKVTLFHNTGVREDIADGLCAIGSGADFAIGAMDAMRHRIGPLAVSPRIAVEIAARRNSGTKLPVHVLTWRP